MYRSARDLQWLHGQRWLSRSDANADSDGDGVPDAKDQCTNTREDIDGYMDDDGCPDLDNDGDGLMDYEDQCPVARESIQSCQRRRWCPDESDRVRIVSNRIQINEKIFLILPRRPSRTLL